MPHQDALTIAAAVVPTQVPRVTQLLSEMRKDPGHNAILPFGRIPGLHFGRIVLIPSGQGPNGETATDQLLLVTDCDGPANDHLEALVETASDGLDRLFSACEGYPDGPLDAAKRLQYLQGKRLHPRAYYVHQQGRTVSQIQREADLRKRLQAFVAACDFDQQSARTVRDRIRSHVKRDPALEWALEPAPGPELWFKLREAIHHATLPAGLVALGPVLLPAIGVLIAALRLQESRDYAEHVRPTSEQIQALIELEDRFANSGYTAAAFVKPGLIRGTTVRLLLELIGWGARHVFTNDSLAGVRTIHFARWIPLDQGRVVFCSNYDGSVESYNNDFIDLVAAGLNLIFSNAYGYPRTTFLIRGGAMREQEFKDYLRRVQIPTPVWHSAYPDLTAANIDRNTRLRAGLRGRMNEREAREWLTLI
jgi:hypothetical protein